MLKPSRRIGAAFLLISLVPLTSFGWNRTGHRAIALIAYRELDPATRHKVAELLRKNPAAHDLWTDRRINSENDPDVDAFFHAATFPDDVRPPSTFSREFHHGTHHYVNIRYAPGTPSPSSVALPPGEENILTSYRANIASVKAGTRVPDDQRAVALCWIFHQEGDIHQPLHAVARFSKTFPEGDRGGNLVSPFPNPRGSRFYSRNLHAYWDDLLGDDDKLKTFDQLAHEVDGLVKEYPRDRFSPAELATLDILDWANESRADAIKTVYRDLDPEIKSYSELPTAYEAEARKLGRRRIALAGYRMAAVLKVLFKD